MPNYIFIVNPGSNIEKVLQKYEYNYETPSAIRYVYDSLTEPGKVGYITEDRMKYFPEPYKFPEDLLIKYGYKSKPGKFLKKLFPDTSDKMAASFGEVYRELYAKPEDKGAHFELWADVRRAYHYENYYNPTDHNGTLWNSCMRHSSSQDYLVFYERIGTKVLVLLKEYRVAGRALVWENLKIPGKDELITFMDRIYTENYEDEVLFKSYAKEHSWYYKQQQSFSSQKKVINPQGYNLDLSLYKEIPKQDMGDYFPFLDTMCYYDLNDSILANDKELLESSHDRYVLQDTGGEYSMLEPDDSVYSEYENMWINTDEAIWIESLSDYVLEDHAIRTYDDSYILEDDAVQLANGDFANKDDDDLVYSEYMGEYYLSDDDNVVLSEYKDDYIPIDDAVQLTNGDYILKEDATEVYIKEYGEIVILPKDYDYTELNEAKIILQRQQEERDKQLYLSNELQ